MSKTKIEWATHVWNPITGCTPISAGCANCYAKRMANRLRGRCGYPADDPFRVTFHPERLDEPAKIKKPSRIFVCSMGDLFHADTTVSQRDAVYDTAFTAPQHTYIILTKRPKEALGFFGKYDPLPVNVWIGVTAENQQEADERIPILLQIPAAVRFVSCEPLLGPVDLSRWLEFCELDWVITGGETGPGARECNPQWIIDIYQQCKEASVPFFFKQWGKIDRRQWGNIEITESTRQFPKGGAQ